MKRRAILLASSAWLAVHAAGLLAQQKPRRIAVLLPARESAYRSQLDIFRNELKRYGHAEGTDVTFEARWGEELVHRLPAVAAELVATKPDVILTASAGAVDALRKQTTSIPIVFAAASDPFVASAKRLKFEPITVRVARVEDIDAAFGELRRQRAEALVLPQLAFMISNRKPLLQAASQGGLPVASNSLTIAVEGGLLSYGTRVEENYRRAAGLVNKILRGAKPGDLAVEQPERFELVINSKTAKLIGVELPATIMVRADRVID